MCVVSMVRRARAIEISISCQSFEVEAGRRYFDVCTLNVSGFWMVDRQTNFQEVRKQAQVTTLTRVIYSGYYRHVYGVAVSAVSLYCSIAQQK